MVLRFAAHLNFAKEFHSMTLCGQMFLPPENRSPKEAAAEVMDAFKEHIRELHAEKLCGEGGEP